MYENGQGGLPRDIRKARELYKKSAAQGFEIAIKNLKRTR
jgi:TPR repeat protein